MSTKTPTNNVSDVRPSTKSYVPRIHPTSKWCELARDDDLTLWDVHRNRRPLITSNKRIKCPLKMLNPHLRCVICLGYLRETTTVMVCLHRFCGECINKCIRMGMKECPHCRKFIPSRRSLRRDKNFDQIVNYMVGNPEIRNKSEEEGNIQDSNQIVHLQRAIRNTKQLVDTQKQQQQQQQLYRQTQGTVHERKSNRGHVTTKSTMGRRISDKSNGRRPIQNLQSSPLLQLELRRHPREDRIDRLERGLLSLRGDATVSLLKTFLSQKIKDVDYEISSTLDDDSVVLDDDLPLTDAKATLCPGTDQMLILKYRVAASVGKRQEGESLPSSENNETLRNDPSSAC